MDVGEVWVFEMWYDDCVISVCKNEGVYVGSGDIGSMTVGKGLSLMPSCVILTARPVCQTRSEVKWGEAEWY